MENINWPVVIFGFLSSSSVIGFITFLLKGWFERRKVGKEATKLGAENLQIVTTANISQLQYMRTEMEEVQSDLRDARQTIKNCNKDLVELVSMLRNVLIEMRDHRPLTTGEQRIVDGGFGQEENLSL